MIASSSSSSSCATTITLLLILPAHICIELIRVLTMPFLDVAILMDIKIKTILSPRCSVPIAIQKTSGSTQDCPVLALSLTFTGILQILVLIFRCRCITGIFIADTTNISEPLMFENLTTTSEKEKCGSILCAMDYMGIDSS
ncbi:hypothetical protein GJ496_009119 [Pomphorhynchus laevis]|nr:hypothetical protein GJ496_009119 [Pomphorhynchus laevis]